MTGLRTPLYIDDTHADIGDLGLAHAPKSVLNHKGSVLTRSIERPAVRAGTECPRCSGSMFLERQMHSEPELVCQACGCSEVPVDLPALLELSEELAINETKRKGRGGNTLWNQPNRNGEEM